jgi:N6-L-threonylcarbamoyladenine synthase
MKILAFETSCDDTSIAVFENEKLLFMDTMSQITLHNITGWVVPEVAAREHANNIFKVLSNVLNWIKINLKEIDYIAVTTNPWLMPSLLTWTTVASTISTVLQIPILPINHIEAHIFANFLERKEEEIKFPLVCLTVSGWHNEIYYMKDMFSMERLGWTIDDAAWEAFDKVAKMMWLWYPGWPIVSKLSSEFKWKSKDLFPRVWLTKQWYDFSFSWLKSSVKREIDKRWELSLEDKKEISFEFENAVIEVLAYKLENAWIKKWVKNIVLAGWVSANDKLVKSLEEKSKKKELNFSYPTKKIYCWDNAAMVWINAFYKIKYKKCEEKIWVVKM